MPEPRTEKEVCGFLGRLNYISRFISHLTATCEPIFKLLRKDQTVKWNDDCRGALKDKRKVAGTSDSDVSYGRSNGQILYLTSLRGVYEVKWVSMTSLIEKSMQFTLAKSLPIVKQYIHCSGKLDVLWHRLLAD